ALQVSIIAEAIWNPRHAIQQAIQPRLEATGFRSEPTAQRRQCRRTNFANRLVNFFIAERGASAISLIESRVGVIRLEPFRQAMPVPHRLACRKTRNRQPYYQPKRQRTS